MQQSRWPDESIAIRKLSAECQGPLSRINKAGIALAITDMGAGEGLQTLNNAECMLQVSWTGIMKHGCCMLDKSAGSIY
jgi:hypothetical protein